MLLSPRGSSSGRPQRIRQRDLNRHSRRIHVEIGFATKEKAFGPARRSGDVFASIVTTPTNSSSSCSSRNYAKYRRPLGRHAIGASTSHLHTTTPSCVPRIGVDGRRSGFTPTMACGRGLEFGSSVRFFHTHERQNRGGVVPEVALESVPPCAARRRDGDIALSCKAAPVRWADVGNRRCNNG